MRLRRLLHIHVVIVLRLQTKRLRLRRCHHASFVLVSAVVHGADSLLLFASSTDPELLFLFFHSAFRRKAFLAMSRLRSGAAIQNFSLPWLRAVLRVSFSWNVQHRIH